ncbi:MAG: PEP-CTERM sorting domain-containing protein, partial [Gammaproteobacteria bacterium]|nr:PEP-CTERM sorting domain-containing protein [Gammaproteobacteria bacterium]
GYLVNYSSPRDMEYYHDEFTGDRKDEIVAVGTSWWQRRNAPEGSWSVGNGVISFAFNVASLNLSDSAQLAFRWSQTCANDIAMGVGKQPGGYTPPPPPPGNTIPEPAVLGLMLAGFAGLGFTRRRPKECLVA